METVEIEKLNALILRLESELQSKGKINLLEQQGRRETFQSRREKGEKEIIFN